MSFLGCLLTHFTPRDFLRIFVVVVVVFNYIKYAFNSTRTGRNLKKGSKLLLKTNNLTKKVCEVTIVHTIKRSRPVLGLGALWY